MSSMLTFPHIDPVALQLGPLQVHWYGLMYLTAFALFYWLATQRIKHPAFAEGTGPAWTRESVEDLLFYGVVGVILGGRLGYVVFYKPAEYFANPLDIFAVWQGGMSFHGGFIGVMVAMAVYAWRFQRPWLQVMDLVAPCVPTGLAAGRLGNFINGELWGRVAHPDLPWAMVFPGAGPLARHPSQIYQLLLEGLVLFAFVWWYAQKPRPLGAVAAVFAMGYGVARFVAEFFREPDAYLGLLGLGLSMGQWLSLPMVAGGALLWVWAQRRH